MRAIGSPRVGAVLVAALVAVSCRVGEDRRVADLDGGVADGGLDGPGVCGTGAVCPRGTACVLGTVATPDGGAPRGLCRPLCTPGDPEGGACAANAVCVPGALAGEGACLPFAEVDRDIGAPCPAGGADCVQGVCVETPRGRRCGRTCTPGAPVGCPDVATCEPLPAAPPGTGDVAVCAPVGATGTLAADAECPNGGADCASGVCVDFGDGRRCGERCAAAGVPCGTDRVCREAATVEGESLAVCGPESGRLGDTCERGMEDCRSQLCLVRGQPTGVCTQTCDDDASCPSDWRCNEFRGPDGQPAQVCAPLGAIGERCRRGTRDCRSTLCLVTGTFGICTEECARAADCPDGWRCVEVPGRDGRIRVCSPPFG
jgi:hypothetical protein